MFRIETLVYIALVITGASAYSADTNPFAGLGNSKQECAKFINDVNDPVKAAKMVEGAKRLYGNNLSNRELLKRVQATLCNTGSNNSSSDCEDARKDFDVSEPAFTSACQTLGLPDQGPNGGEDGHIACSWSKERCNCTKKGFEDTDDLYQCSDVRASDKSGLSKKSSSGLIDLKHAELNMRFCPQNEADDIERYEKQLEKSQERIKELKKKMPDTMTKGNEAQDKAAQAQNDASRKAVEAQKEFANELKEIKRKREGDEQQAVAEMGQARQEMDKIDAQIRQIEMQKVDAEVKLGEAKTQIELNCHATASQQVAARQAQRMASIQKGMPRGDFNSLMNNVGVSSRAAWEKVARVYYNRCINSRPTRESKKSAQNIYESTLRQLDSAISTARQGRARIEEQLKTIMSSNGCAPPVAQPGAVSSESRMCRSMRQAQEDMQQAYQNQQQQQQQIQQEAITAQRQLAQKNQTLSMEYADAQRELNDEQARMENLRAYLDLKRQYNLGSGTKEAAKELATNWSKLRAAAIRINGCCAEQTITGNLCTRTEKFIKSLGGTLSRPTTPSDQRPADSDTIQAQPQNIQGEGVRERATPMETR
jgi:hypothetical protein